LWARGEASFGFFTADYADEADGFWWDKVDGPDGRQAEGVNGARSGERGWSADRWE
jgi:hypothetical protein